MRIFVTGDTHRDIDIHKLSTDKWPEQKELTRDDILIIAGDFGGVWFDGKNDKSSKDDYFLKWYEDKPFTTVFVDGNHENFNKLCKYPRADFLGAECHQIMPHVYHVMRGEVLHAGGKKIWCMGGARSTDKAYRKPNISWWKQEEPTKKEWKHAYQTLTEERPDIVITHDVNYTALVKMFAEYSFEMPDSVTQGLDDAFARIVRENIPVTDWYFGHHHQDFDEIVHGIRYHALYQRILEIDTD